MMFLIEICTGNSRLIAATYDALNKTLVPVDARVQCGPELGSWVLKLDGEYVMILDAGTLRVGDILEGAFLRTGLRLEIFNIICGARNLIAVLNQDGMLSVPAATEADVLPTGLNLQDVLSFDSNGVTTLEGNEILILADEAGRYITDGGRLIEVQ